MKCTYCFRHLEVDNWSRLGAFALLHDEVVQLEVARRGVLSQLPPLIHRRLGEALHVPTTPDSAVKLSAMC